MAAWTDEPDLRLVVDGQTIRPHAAGCDIACFALPATLGPIRVLTRSLVPAEIDPLAADQRRLGISVRHIALRSAHVDLDVPPGDAALREGWHAAEAGHRWTDGAAVLPASLLAGFDEPVTLELHLNSVRLRYPVV